MFFLNVFNAFISSVIGVGTYLTSIELFFLFRFLELINKNFRDQIKIGSHIIKLNVFIVTVNELHVLFNHIFLQLKVNK